MKKYTKLYTRNKKNPTTKKVRVAKMKIKKGDKVKVISGKDKGKTGVIVRAFPKTLKVVVEGIAVGKRHTKKQGNQSGRIIERPMPIHVSNVQKA